MFKDIWIFFKSVFKNLKLLLTGSVIIATLVIIEHMYGTPLSWPKFSLLILLMLFISCFMVWQEAHHKHNDLYNNLKPMLKLVYSDVKERPWYQEFNYHGDPNANIWEQCQYRFGIFNESLSDIHNIKVVLDKVEIGDSNIFFPGLCLRVMGSNTNSPIFNLAPHATQYIDIFSYTLRRSGEQAEFNCITYAEIGEKEIPVGNYQLLFRVDWGGIPLYIKTIVENSATKFHFYFKNNLDATV